MNVSTSRAVGPASFGDFEVLKEAFLELANHPCSDVTETRAGNGLIVNVEKFQEGEESLLKLAFSGILRCYFTTGEELDVRYHETVCHLGGNLGSLRHDYTFWQRDSVLQEFEHNIRAIPMMAEQPGELVSGLHIEQASKGGQLLSVSLGTNLEPTTGDCGVLFDRMMAFMS